MDLEQLGYFLYMEQCDKEYEQEQRDNDELCFNVIDLPTITFFLNSTPIAFKLSISLSRTTLGKRNGGIPYLSTPPNLCNASNTTTS